MTSPTSQIHTNANAVLKEAQQATSQHGQIIHRQWITINNNNSDNTIRVLQFNVLAQGMEDFKDSGSPTESWDWDTHRKYRVVQEILRTPNNPPDIIGMQELNNYEYIVDQLAFAYEGIFKPKDDSPAAKAGGKPDGCALLFNKNKLELLDHQKGSYVDLETGKKLNQIYILAKFKVISTDFEFVVGVTHLKAKKENDDVRIKEVDFLQKELTKIKVDHAIVMGDFNASPEEKSIEKMLGDGFTSSYAYAINKSKGSSKAVLESEDEVRYTTWKTRGDKVVKRTIDYIFFKGAKFEPSGYLDVPNEKDADPFGFPSWKYPSDHVALMVDFNILT